MRHMHPVQQGSAKWWRLTMRAWREQIGRDFSKSQRRHIRPGSARPTYERPVWSGTIERYARW